MIHNQGGRHTRIEQETKLAGKRIHGKGDQMTWNNVQISMEYMATVIKPEYWGLLFGLEPVQIAHVGVGVWVDEGGHWVIGKTGVIQGVTRPASQGRIFRQARWLMFHGVRGEIAGTERPRIVGDGNWAKIWCLHMFCAVGSRAVTVVDVRFERGKGEHVLCVHQSLEVRHPKLTPRKKNTADSHGSQGPCQ